MRPSRSNSNVPSSGAHHHALQAVGAAGQPVELVGQLVAGSSATPSVTISRVRSVPRRISTLVTSPSSAPTRDRDGQADQRVGHHVLGEQRRGVGAEAEERGMAERDDAGVAEHQVERHREQRDDRDLVEQQRLRGQQQPATANSDQPAAPAPTSASARCAQQAWPATALIALPPLPHEQALRPPAAGSRSSACRR